MDSGPVRIYSSTNVPRLRYTAGIILGDILGLVWEVVSDKRKLGKHPVINYSTENIPGSFKIIPDTLLFETGVSPRDISVDGWKGLPIFFPTSAGSDFPFDIFAATFFLVSRYEEYLDFQPDEYGRFKASSSLAFKNGFLGIPVVDLWARELAKAFLRKFETLTFKRNEYRTLVTIDSDQPFAYQGKNLFRSIGGLLRHMATNENPAGVNRYKIIAKGQKNPFEVFDYITDSIRSNNADARFFFPVGGHSEFDKNPSWKNEEYRSLIIRIAGKFKTGLHPSFYASGNSAMINNEAARLRSILKREINISRFHYIRLFMPISYSYIIKAGITEDYSMGYPEEPGFRAGIARPYYFYDISEDQQTSLKIIPFQVMDSTLYKYKNHDPAALREIILGLINETRKAGGTFVSIWHNTSLIESPDRKGWREVFEFMLKEQIP